MGTPPSHGTKIGAQENRAKALALRKAGASLRQIGTELGVSHQAVSKMILKELADLAEHTQDLTVEYRQLELERLDTLTIGLWDRARHGDEAAVDRVLRVMERRARLLGLDAPRRSEVDASLTSGGGEFHVYMPDNGRFGAPPEPDDDATAGDDDKE